MWTSAAKLCHQKLRGTKGIWGGGDEGVLVLRSRYAPCRFWRPTFSKLWKHLLLDKSQFLQTDDLMMYHIKVYVFHILLQDLMAVEYFSGCASIVAGFRSMGFKASLG